jgi:hypothetical protein
MRWLVLFRKHGRKTKKHEQASLKTIFTFISSHFTAKYAVWQNLIFEAIVILPHSKELESKKKLKKVKNSVPPSY